MQTDATASSPARRRRPGAAGDGRPPLRGERTAVRPAPALLLLALLLLALPACRTERPAPPVPAGGTERGVASWYGEPFHGRRTASGEVYDMHRMTAAHKSLPFHTLVEVVNLDNGRRTRVRINDRGPFVRGRIIDLSYAAARELGLVGPGTARVELRILGRTDGPMELARDGTPVYGYTVQVGSFRERRRAEALRDELARNFADVVIRREGRWHRVQVGELASREQAEALRRTLADAGLPAVIVGLR